MVAESYPLLEGHLNAGRLDQAESVARHILGREPDDMTAHCALARLTAMHGQTARAIELLEDLVAGAPRDPLPMAWLAIVVSDQGELGRGLELARRASDLGAKVPEVDTLLGHQAWMDGDLDEALGFYEAALARHPEHAGAWHGKGRAMRDLGELVMAEDAFVHAVQYGPERIDAWYDLVKLEQDAGAHEVAAENLVLALKAHPGHPDLLALKANEQVGPGDAMAEGYIAIRNAVYAEDVATAAQMLDRLVEDYPTDGRLAVVKAEVVMANDSRAEIPSLIHELQRLVRADAMAWEPRVALGRLLLRESPLQNTRMALAHCEEAFRLSGEHPHAGIGLVEAWAATQKMAYARALLTRLAQGSTPEAGRAQAILEGRIA
jgi:tetratricopeptide (TPR) repeat protein